MTYWERLLAEYVGGGDSPISPTLIAKSITTNGTYNAVDDEADGYSSVSVNVPNTSTLKGTLPLTFKTSEEQLRDWTIYGSNYEHTYSAEGRLPLTFTSHTAGNASDWEISGNDNIGKNQLSLTNYASSGSGNWTVDISEVTGEVILNGTATGSNGGQVLIEIVPAEEMQVYFSASPSGGSGSSYNAYMWDTTAGGRCKRWDGVTNSVTDLGNTQDNEVILPAGHSCKLICRIAQNYVAQNVVFKPMLRPAGTSADFEPYQVGVGERTVNLFNKATATAGYRIAGDGAPYLDPRCKLSDYIEVSASTAYVINTNISYDDALAQYDANKTFIERTVSGSGNFTASATTKYVRISMLNNNVNTKMLVKGSTAPSTYVPYGYEIPISTQGKNKMPVPVNGTYTSNRITVTVTDGVYHIVQTEGSGSSSVYIDLPEFEVLDSGYINYLNSKAYANSAVVLRYNGASLSGGYALTPINRAVAIGSDYAGKKVNQIQIYTTGDGTMDFTIAPMMTDSNTYTTYIPYFHNDYTFYIGNAPLTEGQAISKASTGVDIAAQAGSNTITTSLYNKPEMSITGLDYVGVGEPVNDSWQIPLTVSDGTNTATVNVPIEAPLTSTDSVSGVVDIPTYVGTNTIDTTLVEPVTADIVYVGANSTLINKTVNQNGTYFAYSDNANGYNSVAVDVPNTYTNEDESKVVHNGELVAQTTASVTTNGIVDTTAIRSVSVNVPTAGSVTGDVRFLDYDGTVVQAYSKSDFASLTALPANPTHEGLTAQGWNWSLEDAKTYVAAYDKLDIGQMYITNDGKTRLYVTLDDGRLNPTLAIAVNGSCDVDWGDGTTHDTLTGTNLSSRVAVSHTYATGGDYVIALTVTGSFAFVGGSDGSLLLTYNNTGNDNRTKGYRNILRGVEIGDGITTINRYAFANCLTLSNITIPDSVISIEDNVFNTCIALSSITIPDNVESVAAYTFDGCYALSSVTIPNSVTLIGGTAFRYCYSLPSVTIPNSVTRIGVDVFRYCYALSSVTIPNSITEIGSYAFDSCYSLSSVTISNGVTTIEGSVFGICRTLVSVTIPNSVTSISAYAFSGCATLPSITIPASVTSMGGNVFASCGSLGSIVFQSETPPTISSSSAFYNVPTDCIIYVPTGSLADYTSASNYPSSSSYTYVEY